MKEYPFFIEYIPLQTILSSFKFLNQPVKRI